MINNKNIAFIKAFGLKLRQLRKARNLSQEKLAYDANVPISQIGRIERGEINTTISTLYHLSQALQVEPDELLKFKREK